MLCNNIFSNVYQLFWRSVNLYYILKCFSRGRKLERAEREGKESCSNISQFTQNLVTCWVPSLVHLTPPLIKSHMVIPSCQAAFISSKNPRRSCLMGLLQDRNHRVWVEGGCTDCHSYKSQFLLLEILLWLDVRKRTHNQPKVFSEHPLNLSSKAVQPLLIIYVLFKTQMK